MSQQSANFGRQRRVEFGHYLRELRERRVLQQKEVARELHINLCDIEKGGRSVSVAVLIRLAEKYNVPLEELLRKKYSPQLPLLDGIMRPTDLVKDLQQELHPEDMEELTRYIAFLLLKRATANRS
jgi:transcriptional regulator with XRE-family HTH domain